MSFQKAHSVSNELGEVVVTSAEVALNAGAGNDFSCNFPAPFKTYRVLEVGFVVTNNIASTDLTLTIGNVGNGDEYVATTGVITIAANSLGTKFSTNTGAFDFVAAGTAGSSVDAAGVPFLSPGQTVQFETTAAADAATGAVFFARLAPQIEYKD
jgi:hypothetical protein